VFFGLVFYITFQGKLSTEVVGNMSLKWLC